MLGVCSQAMAPLYYRADAPIMAHLWEYVQTTDFELGYLPASQRWHRQIAIVISCCYGLVKYGPARYSIAYTFVISNIVKQR